ncbi:MAG: hypothetical protein HKN24_05965 [Acidimicrobiales bacterium]|nr:hypothetical protein [Acidimicrobiales bacterium]
MSDQSGSSIPGWYHAEGDPPGTHRYWDGIQWQGGPQVVGSAPGSTIPPQGSYGYGAGFAENSQAVTALVLAIFGLFCCGVPAAVGWYIANQETQGIDQGRRAPSSRGTATAAKVIGIVAVLLWGALYLLWFVGLAVARV